MKQILIQYDTFDDSGCKFTIVNSGDFVDVTIVVCESNYNIPISILSIELEPGVRYWFTTQPIHFLVDNKLFSGFRYLVIDNKTGERFEYRNNHHQIKKIDIQLPDIYLLGDPFLPYYDALYTNNLDYIFENKYPGWFIDLGANLGAYTSLAIVNGYENCLLVEPSKQLVESLTKTFDNFRGVNIEQAVVTNKQSESVKFNLCGSAQVANFVSESGDVEVKNYRISDLVDKYDIKEIANLKIDIEGQEYEVVFGLDKSILDITWSISLETHLDWGGDDINLIDYLINMGFNHRLVSQTETHKEHFFWKLS